MQFLIQVLKALHKHGSNRGTLEIKVELKSGRSGLFETQQCHRKIIENRSFTYV